MLDLSGSPQFLSYLAEIAKSKNRQKAHFCVRATADGQTMEIINVYQFERPDT